MMLSGIFVAGSSNILFGVLDKVVDVNAFIILCFVVRTFMAIGAGVTSVRASHNHTLY